MTSGCDAPPVGWTGRVRRTIGLVTIKTNVVSRLWGSAVVVVVRGARYGRADGRVECAAAWPADRAFITGNGGAGWSGSVNPITFRRAARIRAPSGGRLLRGPTACAPVNRRVASRPASAKRVRPARRARFHKPINAFRSRAARARAAPVRLYVVKSVIYFFSSLLTIYI